MTQAILQLDHITKAYNIKRVLEGASLLLNRGERVALVGENGTGKTTLAKIIVGHETSDSGTITFAKDATIGYLPQEVAGDDELSVQQYIERATGDLDRIVQRMGNLEKRMGSVLDDEVLAQVLEEYGALQATYEQRGGYDLPARMEQVFAGLGITYIDAARQLQTLSGGERTRVALAGLLLQTPDLLVLDEPTNHLDFAGIDWLENYLAHYENAVLLITHDREFINRVANVITELSASTRQLTTYYGNYDDFLQQREAAYQHAVEAYNSQKNQIKALKRQIKQATHNQRSTKIHHSAEGDKHIRYGKGQQADRTRSKQVRDLRGQLDELEVHPLKNPRHEWRVEFRFDPLPSSSSEPLRFMNLSKSFGAEVLFENLSSTIYNGERVVLVAPNGTGKTTLLRLIMGLIPAESGTVQQSPSTKIGYLDQDGETLDWNQTVLESFRHVLQGSDSELLAELHRSGLFSDASLGSKRIGDLSVGQRRKFGLARLIASRANLLLLDEPTNHLDPISLEALEAALLEFDGAMLAVSHDRRFVEKVATRIWRIENGVLYDEAVTV